VVLVREAEESATAAGGLAPAAVVFVREASELALVAWGVAREVEDLAPGAGALAQEVGARGMPVLADSTFGRRCRDLTHGLCLMFPTGRWSRQRRFHPG